MTQHRLLYIFPELSSFVKKDLEFLSQEFCVSQKQFNLRSKAMLPIRLISWAIVFPFLLIGKKAVVAQFGGYHTVVPTFWCKVFRKKMIIVLGGFDAVAFPEINYGAFANKWMKKAVTFSYKNAALLLPVDESLIYSEYSFYPAAHKIQGIKAFIDHLTTPIQTIYNGYNAAFWYPSTSPGQSQWTCITVAAGVSEQRRLDLKGVQQIIDIAPEIPNMKFIIVGDDQHVLSKKVEHIANINVLPKLSAAELREVFSSSHFYLQLSLSEGFPNALCEAMLCGCVPLVSNVASMPKIIGNTGLILEKRNKIELLSALNKLPNVHSVDARSNARSQIGTQYSEERRKSELTQAIQNCISG